MLLKEYDLREIELLVLDAPALVTDALVFLILPLISASRKP
jgi:hypothetical protein